MTRPDLVLNPPSFERPIVVDAKYKGTAVSASLSRYHPRTCMSHLRSWKLSNVMSRFLSIRVVVHSQNG